LKKKKEKKRNKVKCRHVGSNYEIVAETGNEKVHYGGRGMLIIHLPNSIMLKPLLIR
jgi:hypothetical protein